MRNTNIALWRQAAEMLMPGDGQERVERETILLLMDREGDALLSRDCAYAHLTASAIIVNDSGERTLMAYHRIYDTWAWTGGHADGERDPEALARREAEEETGIRDLLRLGPGPLSLEVLPVWTHMRRGKRVGSHLHLNLSYVFRGDDSAPLRIAPEENRSVAWLPVPALSEYVTEKAMMPVYRRLLDRANVW